MDELRNYLDSFLKILLELFNDALLEHPEKMVNVEVYSLTELERVYAQLEAQEKDPEALRKTVTDYFNEFDVDKSNTLDRQELHSLIREFFKRQDLSIPIDKGFIDEWFIDLDADHNGKIELKELINLFGPFNSMLCRMYKAAIQIKKTTKN